MRTRYGRAVLILLIVLAGASGIVYHLFTRDASGSLLRNRGPLTSVRLEETEGISGSQKYLLTITGGRGLSVRCGCLVPRREGTRVPAIILLGGKQTGRHAVDYALGVSGVLIVSPDYPFDFQESYTAWQFLKEIPAMRRALLDLVPSIMLVIDYLWQRNDVDTTKIVLLGYSFGAPLVPATAALDRRLAAAAMVYGGGDLRTLVRHNVRRYRGPILSELAGAAAGLLLRPLEPMQYVDRIAPTPLIMINGTDDEQIPRQNVEMLYNRAREPKNLVWLQSRHVRPTNVGLTRQIIQVLEGELARLDIVH